MFSYFSLLIFAVVKAVLKRYVIPAVIGTIVISAAVGGICPLWGGISGKRPSTPPKLALASVYWL